MGKEGGESQRAVVPFFEELVTGTMQAAAEAGAAAEHRALSYLVSSYPAIYAKAAEAYGRSFLPTELAVRPSGVRDDRKIMDVIFSFTNYETEVTEKYRVQVDVTDELPTLVTEWSEYSGD